MCRRTGYGESAAATDAFHQRQENRMKLLATVVMSACLALAAGTAAAQDKKDAMAKPMTMKECQDHMAMMKKEGMKKDDAMMKKDAACAEMMKKADAMKKEPAKEAPKK
jgi:hypothetical protein